MNALVSGTVEELAEFVLYISVKSIYFYDNGTLNE